MLTLINTNRMTPPIAPVGLDYIASTAHSVGIEVEVIDLAFADDVETALRAHFDHHQPELVGLSFRNTDDCFWPRGEWFVPKLVMLVAALRELTRAPIVLGGAGYSIFAERILAATAADFGIRGDGERAVIALYNELRGQKRFDKVAGLVLHDDAEAGRIVSNAPAWPAHLSIDAARDNFDNARYFRQGGQLGVETRRGCPRNCIYCADALAKGTAPRLRPAGEVADEIEALLRQDIDVLHLCDSEFNVPVEHARAVCDELVRRALGEKVRWYTYMAVVPFDEALAKLMRRAGCVGINFTGDSASQKMLATYRQLHRREDIAHAASLCKKHDIRVMIDLLLGGPGETPETISETVKFIKDVDPDCAGASLGIRIYPHTQMERIVADEGSIESNENLRRSYAGPIDLFKPTFYVSSNLGDNPAALVRELIGDDKRFFRPSDENATESGAGTDDHNYNDSAALAEAIADGARGAYWDILRKLHGTTTAVKTQNFYPGSSGQNSKVKGKRNNSE